MSSNKNFFSLPFTVRYGQLVNEIRTELHISAPENTELSKALKCVAIWDTGAQGTVMTKKIAQALGLKPTGKRKAIGVNSSSIEDTHVVNLFLPNGLRINSVEVMEGALLEENEVLIGMDIIAIGDFAISNADKKTTMSFRFPSFKEINFVEEDKRRKAIHDKSQR